MLKTKLLAALFLTASVTAVSAQNVSTDPTKIPSGTYRVEPSHTQVEFAIAHMGFSVYYGRFSDASGSLTLNSKMPSGSALQVSIPTDTVSTTSAKLNDELKGADWLDAAHYPQISFRTTSVIPTGVDDANVVGQLTLHGVTKPVTLKAHLMGAGINPLNKQYTVGFQVSGLIKRSDFGVTKYLPLIGDDVRLTISGAFEKQN